MITSSLLWLYLYFIKDIDLELEWDEKYAHLIITLAKIGQQNDSCWYF